MDIKNIVFKITTMTFRWPAYLYTLNTTSSHIQVGKSTMPEPSTYKDNMQIILDPMALTATNWAHLNTGKNLLTEIGFTVTMPGAGGESVSGSLSSRNNKNYQQLYLEFTAGMPWNFAPDAGANQLDKDRFTWTDN